MNKDARVIWSEGELIMQMLSSENEDIRQCARELQAKDRVERMRENAFYYGIEDDLITALQDEKETKPKKGS